ncbi:hypothetical protein AUP68_12973 [Ilyonectria robusta]
MNTPESSSSVEAMNDQAAHGPAAPKRIRLSLACNQCRKRKVRCDAETPKCRNCVLRGDNCETSDPRRPDGPAVRKWATRDGLFPGEHREHRAGSISERSATSSMMSLQFDPTLANASESTQPAQQQQQNSPGGKQLTWVTRAYMENTNTRDAPSADQMHDSPDVVVNTDESSHRVKYMGGSSLQCLCVFVDLYLSRNGQTPMSDKFRWGMKHVEEFSLPLSFQLPDLPPTSTLEPALRTFFDRIYPLFPVVEQPTLMADIQRLTELQESNVNRLQGAISHRDLAALATIYSVISIGTDEFEGNMTEAGETYIKGAYTLLGHLTSMPYIGSVQALLVLAIALRGRGKEGQAWHLLGQAIRISHSIGLHRHISLQMGGDIPIGSSPGYKMDRELHSRLWWSCYALEKLMELETGRPPAISDNDCDQLLPRIDSQHSHDYFSMWVSLARILGQISEHLYRRKMPSSFMLMSETARLDQALLDWSKAMPEGMKPGHDVFLDDEGQQPSYRQHIASFLSLQYYQAQITLFRASLVFPEKSYANEVKKHGSKLTNNLRLLQNQNICIGAARSIIKQVLELADHNIHSLIFTTTQPFLAAIVLALNILKNPQKRMGRSDMELVITGTEYARDHYQRIGQHEEFIQAASQLPEKLNAALETMTLHREHRPSVTSQGVGTPPSADTRMSPSLVSMGVAPFTQADPFYDPFQDLPLDEFWSMIGGDFVMNSNNEQNSFF